MRKTNTTLGTTKLARHDGRKYLLSTVWKDGKNVGTARAGRVLLAGLVLDLYVQSFLFWPGFM